MRRERDYFECHPDPDSYRDAGGSQRDREEILHSVQDDSFESCHPELVEGSQL